MPIVYRVSKEESKINKLGEQGWEVFNENPLIVAIPFKMPKNADILDKFIGWIEKNANTSAELRKYLTKNGFKFNKVLQESTGERVYRVQRSGALLKWRFEFNYQEDDQPMAYITFGPIDMNTPAFANKEIVDKYVPSEIIEKAKQSESIFEKEEQAEEE